MAPSDSTRCLRCRCDTLIVIDDGSNPPFLLCSYCLQALSGMVTIIAGPVPKANTRNPRARRTNPRRTNSFWKKRREVTGR